VAADGFWNVKMNTPMGPQAVTLTLATSGTALSGSLDAPHPLGKVEFSDGTVDGDNLVWTANLTSPMPIDMDFTATVSGDTITGNVKLGDFGDSAFEGTRGAQPSKATKPASEPIGANYRAENHRHKALSAEWVEALRRFCVDNARFAAHNLPPISIILSWEFTGAPADMVHDGHERAGFFIRIKDGKATEVGGVPPEEADGRIIMAYDQWAPALSMNLEEDMAFMNEIFNEAMESGSISYEGDVSAFGPYVLVLRKEFFPVYTA
jgi:hypothetical protein